MQHSDEHDKARCPYDMPKTTCRRTRLGCAGMSLVETAVWLVIIAALALGMIWLLWRTSH